MEINKEQLKQLGNIMFKVYNIINVIESLDDDELGNLAGIQSQKGFEVTGEQLINFFKTNFNIDIG